MSKHIPHFVACVLANNFELVSHLLVTVAAGGFKLAAFKSKRADAWVYFVPSAIMYKSGESFIAVNNWADAVCGTSMRLPCCHAAAANCFTRFAKHFVHSGYGSRLLHAMQFNDSECTSDFSVVLTYMVASITSTVVLAVYSVLRQPCTY